MRLADRCAALPWGLRRVLAATLLLGVVFSAWLLVIPPLQAGYESQQRWRSSARQLLAYSKGSVLALDQLQAEVSAMRASTLWSKLYRVDQSGAAAGLLQAEVATLLTQAKAGAQSFTPLRSVSLGGLTQVGVHVTAALRIDQFQQFVTAVRAHSKYLRIEQLTISAPPSQTPTENPILAVDMDIRGFELTSSKAANDPRRKP
jgi:Type II secretion system (T2SS), protein M subtype b